MNEPQVLRLTRHTLTLREVRNYKRRQAKPADYHDRLITEPTIIVDAETERVQIVYLAPIEEDTRMLVDVLRHMAIPFTNRVSTLGDAPKSRARIFGYRQPNPRFLPECAPADLAAEDPAGHAVICSFAQVIAEYYRRYAPALYAEHVEQAQNVLPAWVIDDSPFTSGIVNKDSALRYHFDSGNFMGVWSGMLGFRHHMAGGHLSVPSYDLGFEIADKSLLMFEGQGLLHGVTRLEPTAPDAYRYTVVYYSLEHMWECLPPALEAERHRLRLLRQKPAQA